MQEQDELFSEFLRWKADRSNRFNTSHESLIQRDDTVERHDFSAAAPLKGVESKGDAEHGVMLKELEKLPFIDVLKEAKWRILAGLIFLVGLSVMFACIGTLTFWKSRITWQGWVVLYTLIVSISVMIMELWSITLTFFVGNCVFLFANIITIKEALAGFSNDSIVSIGAMFVIAVALEKTRILEWVARNVLRKPSGLRSALLRILPALAFLSAWTNNTPLVAVSIPVLEVWSIRAEIPVSQLLMPMSFAVILGGLCTIIGTSTNLVIQGLAGQSVDLGFFTVGAVAAPFAVLGVTFMILAGPYLLPKNTESRQYIPRVFAWHRVAKGSVFSTQGPLSQNKVLHVPGAELVWIKKISSEGATSIPDRKKLDKELAAVIPAQDEEVLSYSLQEGDMLLFIGVEVCTAEIYGLNRMPLVEVILDKLFFFELYLSESFSPCTVAEFQEEFSCKVRFVNRNGNTVHRCQEVEPSDVLVVEGEFALMHLNSDARFVQVREIPVAELPQRNPAPSIVRTLHPWIALVVLVFVIVTNAVGLFSLYVAACIGIIALVITGIMNWDEVIAAIPGDLLLMIAYSFALASAMTNSGVGQLLGESFAIAFSGNPYVQLLGIYLVTNIITAVASNAASAAIMYPIVVSYSKSSGLNVYAGLYMIMVASSADFNTPFGYQTNLMVQKPGGYKFGDYPRLGFPITIIGLFLCPAIALAIWPPSCTFLIGGCNATNRTVF